MSKLLGFVVIVDQDRQRLARFALDSVAALGGNSFYATVSLARIMSRLRADFLLAQSHIQTRLVLEAAELRIEWGETSETVVTLKNIPDEETLSALRTRLRQTSEFADPELLVRRNQRISADLEQARTQAAEEMAELESMLDRKKQQLQESIRSAEIDSLTGLLNRGAFDTRLRETFLRRQRQQEPLCLLLLDVDNFKEVNDTRGHQQGDEHLKSVAAAMDNAIREYVDYSCRIGGDEFAVIASTDIGNTSRMGENILEELNYSSSIGIAMMEEEDTIDALIGRADGALYKAKHSGRGRVVIAEVNKAMQTPVEARAVGQVK